MKVGELKKALNQYDDNLEVFTKKTESVGNIGYICDVKKDTYAFFTSDFGVDLPCIVLTDQPATDR
jgi:hypothetical protein